MTQKVVRGGSFPKVGDLIRKINAFVEQDNTQAHPFVWGTTAESILAKIQRLGKYISRTILVDPLCLNHILGIPDGGKQRFCDTVLKLTKRFALCDATGEAMALAEEVAFLQALTSSPP